jgi:hypothetical protein
MKTKKVAEERRARYVRMAREAKKLARAETDLKAREACLVMAGSWLQLARAEDSLQGR